MTERAYMFPRERPSRPAKVTPTSGNHVLARYRHVDGAEAFEEPDLTLVALVDGDEAKATPKPSYRDLEEELQSLRGQLTSLTTELAVKTTALQELEASRGEGVEPASGTTSCENGGAAFRSLLLTTIDSGRRGHSRMPCKLEVEFTHDAEFYAGITQDISQGGIFVVTYHTLPLDTELTLRIELGTGDVVEATGRVRWIREPMSDSVRPGMGIEFSALSPEALALVQRSCNDHAPLYIETGCLRG